MEMTKGGAVGKPPIESLGQHNIGWYESTSADEGDVDLVLSTASLGDVRVRAGFDVFVGPASNYTVTSLRVRNSTRFPVNIPSSWTQLITTPLQMDSTVDILGIGIVFVIFDNDSPMDDIDMGSTSGHPQAHTGSGNNTYVFELIFEHSGFVGSETILTSLSLSDSDA
jgi:hypothetical protein